jgi:hypothetical protein
LNKEIYLFSGIRFRRDAIRDYHRGTVQPGAAMTVKEMGPEIGVSLAGPFLRQTCVLPTIPQQTAVVTAGAEVLTDGTREE